MSKSVSQLLQVSLDRFGKALVAERAPYFTALDDGDEINDEFSAAVTSMREQLELGLRNPESRSSAVVGCLENLREAILEEFERQRETSWA